MAGEEPLQRRFVAIDPDALPERIVEEPLHG
jgi:hypothetical protein